MAMAELVIHDTEDPRMQYPRAPPPSPEAQQRSLGNIFEIPTSAFGPLDLRQQDFAVALDFILTQTDTSRTNSNSSPLSTVPERGSPFANYLTEDDEDYIGFPGSPKKRVCNSPSSFPEGYDSQLSNDTTTSHSQSTRHRKSPSHSNSPPSSRNSNSPPYVQQRSPHSLQQTSPYFIPQKPGETMNGFGSGRFTPNNTPVHSYNPILSPPSHVGMLSKSFDLHNMNPFHTDRDTDLPETRIRSYTLGAPKPDEDLNQRRRKISLKRTKDERDSELQFAFEYSYASTGSSEESDWLVVDRDTTATLPLGKKACQDPQTNSQVSSLLPLTVAHSDPNHVHHSLEQLRYTCPSEPRTDLSLLTQSLNSDYSRFNPSTQELAILNTVRPSSSANNTVYNTGSYTDQQPLSIASVEMMDVCDTSLRLDSLDSMECGPSDQLHSMDTQTPSIRLPPELPPQNIVPPSIIGRSHSSEATSHSFVDNNIMYSFRSNVTDEGSNNDNASTQGFNFSKSL